MFKKVIGLLASASILASSFMATYVHGASDFTIYYSTDGMNWNTLSRGDFEVGTSGIQTSDSNLKVHFYQDPILGDDKNYIEILDKTQYMYLYSDDASTWETFMKNNGDAMVWFYDDVRTNWDLAKMHIVLPVEMPNGDSEENPIILPFKAGRVDTFATIGGERFFMQFESRYNQSAQKFKLLDTNSFFTTSDRAGNVGMPLRMFGSYVANDNQMFLGTYTKHNNAKGTQITWDQSRLWVGANMSKYLCGSSYVSMPLVGISEQYGDTKANNTSTKYFDLQVSEDYTYPGDSGITGTMYTDEDGYAGEVVVLMYKPAAEGSVYLDEEKGWECVNNGSRPEDMEIVYDGEHTETYSIATDRDYNDFDYESNPELNYYGVAIQFIESAYRVIYTGTDGINKNKKRLKTLHGEIESGVEYKDAVELTYAYRKKFKPDEKVSIYSPGNIEVDPDGYQERQGLFIPIIKYYTPENEINEVEAYHNPDENRVYVHVNTTNNYINNGTPGVVIYTLFDAKHEIIDVKAVGSAYTSDEFYFEDVKNPNGVVLKAYYLPGYDEPEFEDESVLTKDYGEIFYTIQGDSLNNVNN